jgi:hypothetical protein
VCSLPITISVVDHPSPRPAHLIRTVILHNLKGARQYF